MNERVKCANCEMVYDRTPKVKSCPSCKSNAADPIRAKGRQNENAKSSGPRLLTDDVPGRANLHG